MRKAKPAEKTFKLYEEKGLCLLVNPVGAKWWCFKYAYLGKEKLLSLGVYPQISLAKAHKRHDCARAGDKGCIPLRSQKSGQS
ncbi:Arm DNA-binding domain-containing protein [Halothiobacillus sp.]|uniref:Arm DNA-binding domain-containing protein n=1 Tax=Halothiobacillus sp. TaxID=1891311 RepID=UPI0034534649